MTCCPYGEYILHESATNESMLLTAPDQTVLVEDDGMIYEFTMADEVVRGGVLIEKRDLESGLLTPLGGASLDGTLFEITNKSINAVYVNGALYQPGEVCATIEVVGRCCPDREPALPLWLLPNGGKQARRGLPPHGPDRALFPNPQGWRSHRVPGWRCSL